MIRPFLSYSDIAATRFYKPDYIPFIVAGAIEEYDLSDLMAGIYPRKLLIVNPLSGDGTMAAIQKVEQILTVPIDVYALDAVGGKIKTSCKNEKQQADEQILRWFGTAN